MTKNASAMRLVLAVALATGLSIMGDSLMYSLLPIDAPRLGIALPLVGVLLSANRLVRLVSNTWAAKFFARAGSRLPFLLSAILGAIVAVVYSVGWGFAVFLLARIGWGVAWSGLRQGGFEAVGQSESHLRGRLMGVLWGTVRLGSAISVVLGGFLHDRWGYRAAAGTIAALTVLAIPVAWRIRWHNPQPVLLPENSPPESGGWRSAIKTPVQSWMLAAGVMDGMFEGALVSTASLFLSRQMGAQSPLVSLGIGVGTVAGLLLAVRFTADLIFAPVIGAVSDRMGQPKTAILLAVAMFAVMAGAVVTPGDWVIGYLVVVFICGAGLFVTLSAASSHIAARSAVPQLFIGAFTTANDAGMAAGPLLVYALADITGLSPVYLGVLALLLVSVWRFWRVSAKNRRVI